MSDAVWNPKSAELGGQTKVLLGRGEEGEKEKTFFESTAEMDASGEPCKVQTRRSSKL